MHEALRRDEAALGVLPADQRLDGSDAAFAIAELGLVIDFHLPLLQGGIELVGEQEVVGQLGIDARIEQHDRGLGGARLVERDQGAFDHFVRGRTGAAAMINAECDHDIEALVVGHLDAFGEASEDGLGQRNSLFASAGA